MLRHSHRVAAYKRTAERICRPEPGIVFKRFPHDWQTHPARFGSAKPRRSSGFLQSYQIGNQ